MNIEPFDNMSSLFSNF